MTLLNNQQQSGVSEQRRMPVDNVSSDALSAVAAETLTFQFYSAGVLTTDAGEAAGTVVVVKLANRNILNAVGDVVGSDNDTSFSFVTGTILTERVDFNAITAESLDTVPGSTKANAITTGFTNGQFCVDHRTGIIYGVKASGDFADTANYSVNIAVSGGGGGIASDVNIDEVDGISSVQVQDTLGTDAAGADAYATILTPSRAARHMYVKLEGANNATISLDGGTTDHYEITANSAAVFDDVLIASGVDIQAKNTSAGNNYTDLSITIY